MLMSPHPWTFNLLSRKLFIFRRGIEASLFCLFIYSKIIVSHLLESFSSSCHVFVFVSCFVIRMKVDLLPLTATLQLTREENLNFRHTLICVKNDYDNDAKWRSFGGFKAFDLTSFIDLKWWFMNLIKQNFFNLWKIL